MLEQMKTQWESILSEQQSTMRDLIGQTVQSAIVKNKGLPGEENSSMASQKNQILEAQIKDIENESKQKDEQLKELRQQVKQAKSAEFKFEQEMQNTRLNSENEMDQQASKLNEFIDQVADQKAKIQKLEREKE